MADGETTIRARKDLESEVEHWESSPQTTWDPAAIRSAIDRNDDGEFSPIWGLSLRCLRDPRVFSGLLQRCLAVTGLPLECVERDRAWEGRQLARKVAEEARAFFEPGGAISTASQLSMLRGEVLLGFRLSQLLWRERKEGGVTRLEPAALKPWPAYAVRWNRTTRTLEARTKAGAEVIRPGDGKWVWHARDIESPWIYSSATRALGDAWADRTYARRDRSRRSTAAAGVGLVGSIPDGESLTGAMAQAFLAELGKLQQGRSRMVKSASQDVKELNLDAGQAEIFDSIIDCADDDIALVLQGQTGSSKQGTGIGDGGNRVHDEVRDDLTEADVEALYPGTIASQILRPWALLNWGRDDIVPSVRRLIPDADEDDRLKAEAERAAAYRVEVRELRDLGIAVDEVALAKARGVVLPYAGT